MKSRTSLSAAIAIPIVAVTMAACSSSGGGGPATVGQTVGTDSASSPALLEPAVKFGIIGDYSAAAFGKPNPSQRSAVQAGVDAWNARGGLAGHKVVLEPCDEAGDPNKAELCAHKFVSDGVLATVGDQTTNADRYDPILQGAGIPRIGPIPTGSGDYTSTNSILTEGGALTEFVGAIKHAGKLGLKKIFLLGEAVPGGDSQTGMLKIAAAKAGLQWVGSADIPPNAPDVSQYVQAAKNSGADFVMATIDQALSFQFFQVSQQLGAKYKVGSNPQVITTDMYNKLGGKSSMVEGVVLASAYPPVDDTAVPAVKQFTDEVDAAYQAGDKNAGPDGRATGFPTWVSLHALDVATRSLKTVPDGKALVAAFTGAKNVDLGLGFPWSPGKKGALIPAFSNPYGFFLTVKNGKIVLDGDQPVDILGDISSS